ncbi:MAG: glycosyltransferase family 39 protein [Anaerolineae bacterium]|nr:glycosyltransferase family 39 protein [Anaerolineae bacterium]
MIETQPAVQLFNSPAPNGKHPSLSHRSKLILAALVGLLLIIFASRVIRLTTLEMDPDEVWSVWQTFGTPADIAAWTPADWSPPFYWLVGAWKSLVGIHPFTVRLMIVLPFLVALAILYRVSKILAGDVAGLIAVGVCASFGYAFNISLLLRGYSTLFMLIMLAWWLMLRYFRKPTRKRAVLLGVCLAAMFYNHLTSIFPMLILGVYTIIVYRWRARLWWQPAVIAAVLVIPELLNKIGSAGQRATTGTPIMALWLSSGASIVFQELRGILIKFAGYNLGLWIALLVIAAALIIERHKLSRRVWGLLLWVFSPLLLFFMGIVDAYSNRHLAWVMPGFALWIGWGFARLPRSAIAGLLMVCTVIMFGDVPFEDYKPMDGPLISTFNWLAKDAQMGDAVLIDPSVKGVRTEEWDYYTRAYFPNSGLNYVSAPGSTRRVWYIFVDGQQDRGLFQQVETHRAVLAQTSDPRFSVRLYEAPPDTEGVPFANGMRFHGMEAVGPRSPVPIWHEGETIHVRLWWSADQAVPLDYSVGLYVIGPDRLLGQTDGAPQLINGPHETSRWITGRYYVDERTIKLVNPMPKGDYLIHLAVYQSWDATRIDAPGLTDDKLLPTLKFRIMSW